MLSQRQKKRDAGAPNIVPDPLVDPGIRRIAIKLAQRRISIDRVLAWSRWRRAHQADACRAHLRRKMNL